MKSRYNKRYSSPCPPKVAVKYLEQDPNITNPAVIPNTFSWSLGTALHRGSTVTIAFSTAVNHNYDNDQQTLKKTNKQTKWI